MKISLKMRIVGLALFAALLPSVTTYLLSSQARIRADQDIEKRMNMLARKEAAKSADAAYLMCSMTYEGLLRRLTINLSEAHEVLSGYGPVNFHKDEKISWTALNQFSGQSMDIELPKMFAGDTWLGQNRDINKESPIVDKAAISSLIFCTIFQRMNNAGDMLRVDTSVIDDFGRRAIGTYIPRVNPDGTPNKVISTVLQGKTFKGRAYVVNDWHAATYEPIWDSPEKKQVVGMLYIGFSMDDALKELREGIMAIRIGDTGYVGVIGVDGDTKGCYIISKDGKRDGVDIWEQKDLDGKLMIQNMVNKALAKPDEVSFEQYYWKNDDDPEPRRKLSAIRHFAPWEWLIFAGVYEDDYYEIKDDITSRIDNVIKFGSIVSGISVVVALFLAFLIGGAIANPIRRVVGIADHIARGELAEANQQLSAIKMKNIDQTDTASGDETTTLYRAVSAMTRNLTSLVSQVQRSGIKLVSTATEIAAASKEQEATVKEFETHTKEVAAAVTQISATSNELSKTMQGVQTGAREAASTADAGQTALTDMKDTMQNLEQATATISGQLSVISEKANTISSVVTTITKVADQTNLLSLNASIEAEKAGEYGTGFAVVAREIRRLADQSAAATLDIEKMVLEMQASVSAGVMQMDKFNEEVRRGVHSIGGISHQMEGIIERVQHLTPEFESVSEGMKAQSEGAQQINNAMTQLSEGARQSTESLRQFNEATQQLREAARALQQEVSRFKV